MLHGRFSQFNGHWHVHKSSINSIFIQIAYISILDNVQSHERMSNNTHIGLY